MSKVISQSGVEIHYPDDTYAALPVQDIEAHTKQLEGRILTLIDAVLSDPQQNKATKDIVRGHFKAKMSDICEDSDLYTGTKYSPARLAGRPINVPISTFVAPSSGSTSYDAASENATPTI